MSLTIKRLLFFILVENIYSRIKSFSSSHFLALTKVYERANSVVTYDVHCPTWLHKYLIGKKGSKLQELIGDLSKQVSFLNLELKNRGKQPSKIPFKNMLLFNCIVSTLISQKELSEIILLGLSSLSLSF